MIANHPLAVLIGEHTAVTCSGDFSAAFKNGVFRRFDIFSQRTFCHGIANRIIRTAEKITGIRHDIPSIVFEQIRAFIPASACLRRRTPFPLLFGSKQKHGFADDARKIRLQLNAINPAFLQPVNLMLIAAARIIQIKTPCLPINVRINNRITRIKNRLIADILKSAVRSVGYSNADAEIFVTALGLRGPIPIGRDLYLSH